MFKEALVCGTNVKEATDKVKLTYHVFNDEMLAFYKNTDAFVIELSVIHMHPYTIEIDCKIIESISNEFESKREVNILMLGDGIGTDTLRFTQLGYKTTYFEYDGYSSRFALYRFKRKNLLDNIRIIHEPDEIEKGIYDVVICREVLEHVPDPVEIISNIWHYLKDNGLAFITESFRRLKIISRRIY